ncbi:MAG: roadblock/LC7 domain-containing protein [Gemmatimonadetes bacterium]|nr:roadblock/LC7 domain-containing protein [Gemmatimonadota bacterium]
MNGLLRETNVKSLLLVDRAGQVVASVGEPPQFDPQAFASLTAADFSANDQLAKMIGEQEFSSLFHQGEKESMYLADVARRVILVALFDNRTTLGMVRLKVKTAVEDLSKLFEAMFDRTGPESTKLEGFASKEAEDEIDKLFGD